MDDPRKSDLPELRKVSGRMSGNEKSHLDRMRQQEREGEHMTEKEMRAEMTEKMLISQRLLSGSVRQLKKVIRWQLISFVYGAMLIS